MQYVELKRWYCIYGGLHAMWHLHAIDTFVNSVISFKSVYIRRVLHKIWQIIPQFATQI